MVTNLVIMLMAMSVYLSLISVTSAAGYPKAKDLRAWTQEELDRSEGTINRRIPLEINDRNYVPPTITYTDNAPSGSVAKVWDQRLKKYVFRYHSDDTAGSASQPGNSTTRPASSKQSGRNTSSGKAVAGSSSGKQTAGYGYPNPAVGSIGFSQSFPGSGQAMAASSHYGRSLSFPFDTQDTHNPMGYGSSAYSPPVTYREDTPDVDTSLGLAPPKSKKKKGNSPGLDLDLKL